MADGPASKAGLRSGDVVLSLDGKTINNANTLIGIVSAKAPNSTLSAVVKRGGDEHELIITVGERPSRGNINRQDSQPNNRTLSREERAYLNELFNQLNRMYGR